MVYRFKSLAFGSVCAAALSLGAHAETFNISGGDLANALDAYVAQTGVQLILSEDAVKGARTRGVRGNLSPDEALSRILSGTGFTTNREGGTIGIVRNPTQSQADVASFQLAQTQPRATS